MGRRLGMHCNAYSHMHTVVSFFCCFQLQVQRRFVGKGSKFHFTSLCVPKYGPNQYLSIYPLLFVSFLWSYRSTLKHWRGSRKKVCTHFVFPDRKLGVQDRKRAGEREKSEKKTRLNKNSLNIHVSLDDLFMGSWYSQLFIKLLVCHHCWQKSSCFVFMEEGHNGKLNMKHQAWAQMMPEWRLAVTECQLRNTGANFLNVCALHATAFPAAAELLSIYSYPCFSPGLRFWPQFQADDGHWPHESPDTGLGLVRSSTARTVQFFFQTPGKCCCKLTEIGITETLQPNLIQ